MRFESGRGESGRDESGKDESGRDEDQGPQQGELVDESRVTS
jgi:hypothetical protein